MEDPSSENSNLSFEEALGRLETIVESIEEGETPLADLVQKYEEGNRLLAICGKRLRDAELRIETLKKTASGSETLLPLEENENP